MRKLRTRPSGSVRVRPTGDQPPGRVAEAVKIPAPGPKSCHHRLHAMIVPGFGDHRPVRLDPREIVARARPGS